ADVAATPSSNMKCPDCPAGVATGAQPWPRQRRARVCCMPWRWASPTAHTLAGPVALTPNSPLPVPTGRGVTRFHAVPFQCAFGVCWLLAAAARPPRTGPSTPVSAVPTAQAFLAEMTTTPCSALLAAGLGLRTRRHRLAFQRRIRDLELSLLLAVP